jgi:methionine-R-sulfoxide reductase
MKKEEIDVNLSDEAQRILFGQGTEQPFTSDLLDEKRSGTYYSLDTNEAVFRSEDKFDSGSGWPSFTKPIESDAVMENTDESHGMVRVEVTSKGGGHLGHVFTDGPKEATGLRYCINGAALKFVPDAPQDGP